MKGVRIIYGDFLDSTFSEAYEKSGLFAKIIDAPAEEAVRSGFDLTGVCRTTTAFYQEALESLKWEAASVTAIKWARLFGGSIAVLLVNDGRGLEEPLSLERIMSIDHIRVYERPLIQPVFRESNPYEPEQYHVTSSHGSFTVHKSRCLVFKNGPVPEGASLEDYRVWGVPEYVRVNRALRDAEQAYGSIPRLLDRSNQTVHKMHGLAESLATEQGEEYVLRRLQLIDMAHGMLNSIAIDGKDDFVFLQVQLAGVPELIDATCNYLSAVTSIPKTILFGGLSVKQVREAASPNDWSGLETYYNFVDRIRNRMLRSNLRYLLTIIFRAGANTGKIPEVPHVNIAFRPLWSLDGVERERVKQKRAQAELARAKAAKIYVDMKALRPTETIDP